MPFSHVWFDLDHTLFDSDACMTRAFERTIAAQGLGERAVELEKVLARVNTPLWRLVEKGELELADLNQRRFEELVAESDIHADAAKLATDYLHWLGHLGELFPGARDVLNALDEHCSLGLITNGYASVQRARMKIHDLDQFFDTVVISGEIGVAKPDARFFAHGFAQLPDSPEPTNVLVVGDSLTSDMAGAVGSGLATCWFNPGHKSRPTDLALDFVIDDLAQIPAIALG